MQIAKSEIETRLMEKVEPIVHGEGFRLVDLDCLLVHHRVVRLFIERVHGESPSLDECARLSRRLNDFFAPDIPRGYDLEVSSPGIERRLRTDLDFNRYRGSLARLKLVAMLEDRANVTGIIGRTNEGHVEVSFEGRTMEIPIASIKQASLVWEDKEPCRLN